ncbi:glycine hydroxymethyltransferase shm1 [Dissophora ornata]|nr:glycine hydroxymethyltransferase shm1 [Dissophora ornata]
MLKLIFIIHFYFKNRSLSHGYQIPGKKISMVSAYFETFPYEINQETGVIDYDTLEKNSKLYRPKIIIAGASAYPREIDYPRMRKIADGCGAYLMADMAHISGLVAANVLKSPFPYSDIVTTTTHKSLRGPRGALIFYRKGVRGTDKKGKEIMYDLEEPINASVFPGHQGGPHNHTIGALAVALKQTKDKTYKEYQEQVLKNSKAFADAFSKLGYSMSSGGTDTHLILVDLRSKNIDGSRVERVLELVNIASNKNTVAGDKSAMNPGGIRVGTPAMTSRGFTEKDFEQVAAFIDRAVNITKDLKSKSPSKMIAGFKEYVADGSHFPEIQALKKEVADFSKQFPTAGFSEDEMLPQYRD